MDAAPSAPQEDVFRLLADAETHGMDESEDDKVRRIDTHAAAVFLAGERVIKVKRAVSYPFLDYSTLDKRKAACLAELEVNRTICAAALSPHRADHARGRRRARFGRQPAKPVEWAVEMTRFDENKTLDRLAERGRLQMTLTRKLAVAVAAMHARAKPVEPNPGSRPFRDSSPTIRRRSESTATANKMFAGIAIATMTRSFRII